MSTNLDFQDDRIIVERHYIPHRLYREIYMGYQQPPTSIAPSLYSPPNNITRQQNPYANPYTNSYTNSYAPIHIDLPPTTQQSTQQSRLHSRLHPEQQYRQQVSDNQPSQRNTLRNRYSREEQPRQPVHTTEDQNIFETPSEIRNLVSNLLNNRMPFELQVSTIPLGMGMGIGLVQNDINSEINNRNQPLSLSNINIISTVSRFEDLSLSFDLSDTCSICQQSFNDNDITRMLNNCKHIFHLTCIDTWLTEHNTCPSCRHNLIDDLTPNISVQTPTHSSQSNSAINNSTASVINLATAVEDNADNTVDTVDNVIIEEIDNGNIRNRNGTINTSPNTRTFSNFSQGTTNGIRDDINHFINIGAPFINSLLPNTSVLGNASPILNTSEINNNVNTLFENFNPFISAFAGLLNGGTPTNSHSNVSANVRMYSSM